MEIIVVLLGIAGLFGVGMLAFQATSLCFSQQMLQWSLSSQRIRDGQQGVLGQVRQLAQSRFQQHAIRFDWRTLLVADIVEESRDCKSFVLIDPTGERLPGFLAGQHVMIERPDGVFRQLRRCYSISNGPGQGFYRLTVKKVAHGSVETSMSQWLHDHVSVGDELRVKGPQGHFFLNTQVRKPVVLLAAGVGITPAYSMLEHLLQKQPQREVWLFYQVRDRDHQPFAVQLEKLAMSHSRFQLAIYRSRSGASAGNSPRHFQGKFTAQQIADHSIPTDAQIYLCGPDAWMQSLVSGLIERGFDRAQIQSECFGESAPPEKMAVTPRPEGRAEATESNAAKKIGTSIAKIEFERSGRIVEVDSSLSLGRSLDAQGVMIDLGCRKGSCGSCVCKLIRGQVIYDRRPDCPLEENEVALCIAKPAGDLVLDLSS